MTWMKGRLIDMRTGRVIRVGDDVADFRGELARVTGWDSPRHPGSSGRVTVRTDDGPEREYYPSVFNLRIATDEEG